MNDQQALHSKSTASKASQNLYYSELTSNVNDLMSAIEILNHEKVKLILTESKDSSRVVNCSCGSLQLFPLQLAASLPNNPNKLLIVQLLLEHGARVHESDRYGRTALYHAATMGSHEVVKLLLDKGANPNTRCTLMVQDNNFVENVSFTNESALPEKFEPPKVWGRTPLHQSVFMNQVLCCGMLLEKGATVNAFDSDDCSPLILAGTRLPINTSDQMQRYEAIVDLLLRSGANVNSTASGDTLPPLFQSVKLGSIGTTSLLLNAGAKASDIHEKTGKNILHIAAEFGKPSIIQHLLDVHIDMKHYINKTDFLGATPLHQAAYMGNKDCLRILIDNDGNLAAKTDNGISVIYAIYQHIPRPREFLTELLDSRIICNRGMETNDHILQIELDFQILAPKSNNMQMSVVSLLSAEQKLIQHPLIEAFIHVKWKKMRWIFLFFFILQVCFVLSLSIFSLILVNPSWFKGMEAKGLVARRITQTILFLSALFLNFHVLLGLIMQGSLRYQLTETSVNSICYMYGIFMAYCVGPSDVYSSNKITVLVHIASLVLLTAWGSLMFQLGRFPCWGYYGLMISAVFSTVFKVMSTGICLFIGFVLYFWIQFPSKFKCVWCLFMMTGELNEEFFFTYNSSEELQCSRLVFFVFILLASMVLTNLMLGLAVIDVQTLQLEGNAQHLKIQTDFILNLERLTTHWILKSRFFPAQIRECLHCEHYVPTKLFVKDAPSAHFGKALPHRIMDGIIPIALGKRRSGITPLKCGDDRELFEVAGDFTTLQVSSTTDASNHPIAVDLHPHGEDNVNDHSTQILGMFKEIKLLLIALKEQGYVVRSNSISAGEDEPQVGAMLRKLNQVNRS